MAPLGVICFVPWSEACCWMRRTRSVLAWPGDWVSILHTALACVGKLTGFVSFATSEEEFEVL